VLAAAGFWYVAEVPCTTPVFPEAPRTEQVRLGPSSAPRAVTLQPAAQAVQAVATASSGTDWTRLTVADGAQGPRVHQFAARRVWESRDEVPGRECWLVLRRNLDGSKPKYYLSNAPAETPLLTLARVGATRWTVETEFQTNKGQVGLDEYEVRSWPGWHHHVALCLLANAFLLSLQQDWTGAGEKERRGRVQRVQRPQRPRVAGHTSPSGTRAAGPAAPAPLDPRRPAPLAGRHAVPQRPRQSLTRQTAAPHAA
jgi:hypothetical protein